MPGLGLSWSTEVAMGRKPGCESLAHTAAVDVCVFYLTGSGPFPPFFDKIFFLCFSVLSSKTTAFELDILVLTQLVILFCLVLGYIVLFYIIILFLSFSRSFSLLFSFSLSFFSSPPFSCFILYLIHLIFYLFVFPSSFLFHSVRFSSLNS